MRLPAASWSVTWTPASRRSDDVPPDLTKPLTDAGGVAEAPADNRLAAARHTPSTQVSATLVILPESSIVHVLPGVKARK